MNTRHDLGMHAPSCPDVSNKLPCGSLLQQEHTLLLVAQLFLSPQGRPVGSAQLQAWMLRMHSLAGTGPALSILLSTHHRPGHA